MTQRAGERKRLGAIVALGVLLSLSAIPRLVHLDRPLLEKNAFRQTQTALTARWFSDAKADADFLHYETPLFGPPWQVPFELPVFQSVVAMISEMGLKGPLFDVACRITAVVFFYLSAILLFLVCCEFLGGRSSIWVLAAYILSPFSIVYSRMCLIDYTSVAFALAYLLAAVKWSRAPFRMPWLVAAIVFGSLAATVKVTTVAMVLPAVLILVVYEIRQVVRPSTGLHRSLSQSVAVIAQLAAFTIIPATVAVLWVMHTDQIKGASILTQWLTSDHLDHWNWGSFSQRFDWRSWTAVLARLVRLMAPGVLALTPAIAIAGVCVFKRSQRVVVGASLAGLALPVLLFFNLYVVHEYYLIAVAAPSAVLVGIGLSVLCEWDRLGPKPLRAGVIVVLLAALPGPLVKEVGPYVTPFSQLHTELDVALMVRTQTEPEAYIAMTQANSEWDSTIPYYARRRFCILRTAVNDPMVDQFLLDHGFRYALLHRANPLRLEAWNKTRISSVHEYDLYSIDYRSAGVDRMDPASVEIASVPVVLLKIEGPDLGDALRPVHQAEVRTLPEGIEITALGNDPVLLMPYIDFPPGHRIDLDIALDSPVTTELKVYFTTRSTADYTEELRARAPVVRGRNNISLTIAHPEIMGTLRLDPGAAAGRFVIRAIEVRAVRLP